MDARKLLHKLARHKYYEAHKNRILAEDSAEASKCKLSELASTRSTLSHLCNHAGLVVLTEQYKDVHNHNVRNLDRAEKNLVDSAHEKCKWQILESRATCKAVGEKKRVINNIESEVLEVRYSDRGKYA